MEMKTLKMKPVYLFLLLNAFKNASLRDNSLAQLNISDKLRHMYASIKVSPARKRINRSSTL